MDAASRSAQASANARLKLGTFGGPPRTIRAVTWRGGTGAGGGPRQALGDNRIAPFSRRAPAFPVLREAVPSRRRPPAGPPLHAAVTSDRSVLSQGPGVPAPPNGRSRVTLGPGCHRPEPLRSDQGVVRARTKASCERERGDGAPHAPHRCGLFGSSPSVCLAKRSAEAKEHERTRMRSTAPCFAPSTSFSSPVAFRPWPSGGCSPAAAHPYAWRRGRQKQKSTSARGCVRRLPARSVYVLFIARGLQAAALRGRRGSRRSTAGPFAQLATGSPTAPDCLPCTPLRSGFVLKSRNVTQYFQVCRANDFSKADYAAWGAPGWCSPREGDGPWTRWG